MEFVKAVEMALARVDGWVNLVTGAGDRRKSKQLTFAPDAILSPDLLEGLYISDPYANRICRIVPQEALRQGAVVATGTPARDDDVKTHFDTFEVNAKLSLAWTWARVFGGGALVVGADDGLAPEEPLREDAIRSVCFVDVADARELQPHTWQTDKRAPGYGEPLTYRLQRVGGGGAGDFGVWHRSRLVIFDGAPTTRRRRMRLNGWGESELQRLYDVLGKFNGGWEATGTLLQVASEGVLKLKNLMTMLAGDKEGLVKRRFEMMDLARGVTNSVLLDADGEEYTRTEVGALGGVAAILSANMLHLSGAAEIPVIMLMGQSPSGFSSGDGDLRWFYDRLKGTQEQVLLPKHRRLARILLAAKDSPTRGEVPPKLAISYPPLWQLDPLQESTRRKTVADTDAVYIQAQVVTPDEVAASRFQPGGWTPETTIDLGAREEAQGADRDAAALTAGQGAEGDAPDAEGAAAIVAKVAARELPRDAGVALLTESLGMAPDAAERVMGEAGRSFFTTPEPGHAAQLADAQGQVAQLTRSRDGVRQILSRVLERNRNGELVVGRLIAKAPTDAEEGDVLEEGDTIPAEGDPPAGA